MPALKQAPPAAAIHVIVFAGLFPVVSRRFHVALNLPASCLCCLASEVSDLPRCYPDVLHANCKAARVSAFKSGSRALVRHTADAAGGGGAEAGIWPDRGAASGQAAPPETQTALVAA
jgi:hypothetical protein